MARLNAMEILIVEDSPTQAEDLKYMLERRSYAVSVAKNGKEAFESMRGHKPDLVISDIMMPEMDGFTLCKRIKAEDDLRDIPVILLTALSDTEDILKGLECGADNFITKPYNEKYLLDRIHRVPSAAGTGKEEQTKTGVEILFREQRYFINSRREHILDLLLSTYETAVMKNRQLRIAQQELKVLNEQLEYKVRERTAELAESEERYRKVLETAQEGIWFLDAEARITFVNRSLAAILGYKEEELLGCSVYEFMDEPSISEFRPRLERRTGTAEQFDLRLRTKDGSTVFAIISINSRLDRDGQFIGSVSMLLDITERKRLESIAQAASLMDNIGYIFSGVRHEMGNPINTLKTILTVLRKNFNNFSAVEAMNYLDHAIAEIGKMEFLLKSLKNFNMYENLEPEKIEMNAFLRRFLTLVEDDFRAKGIKLEASLTDESITALADPRALQQVLLNLMINAADAFEERQEPAIKLFLYRIKDTILIKVEDNGRGIPEENRKNLFKPFYTTKAKGTGLGLVMVKKMMAKMNGDVEIFSQAGQGTAVNLFFPGCRE